MSIADVPVVRAFREKLKFHGQRQRVLAENIANATTPGYSARDIKAPDFLAQGERARAPTAVAPMMTSPAHLPGTTISTRDMFRPETVGGYEVTPDGNGVVLEEQMMKVAENQMDYQIATSLYQRSIAMLKTAVGRG